MERARDNGDNKNAIAQHAPQIS